MTHVPRQPSPLRRNLRYSVVDGTAYTVMAGLAESFFPLFVLELGLGEVAAGLVLTIPMFLAATVQLATPRLVRRIGSYRAWVVGCAASQALALVPLVLIALRGQAPAWVVFACATAYWTGAVSCGPAWTAWMGLIIPDRLRARYFSRRNRCLQLGLIAGLVAGAGALHLAGRLPPADDGAPPWRHDNALLYAFAALFFIAAIARSISTLYLFRQSEPRPLPITERMLRGMEVARRLRASPEGRLIVALVVMQAAIQVGLPFWHPFVRERLGFAPLEYVALLVGLYAGRAVALPLAGEIAHRRGPRSLLRLGSLAIVPLSLLWIVSPGFWWLFGAQLVGGAAMAMFDLGAFLMMLRLIPDDARTSMVARYMFLNALAMCAGSLVGGALLSDTVPPHPGYALVFVACAAARLAALPLTFRVPTVRIDARPDGPRGLPERPAVV
ncbi:MAG: MFS transporter [Phycisphaerae bacterium]|nr:MFS transporter [Phycisphaerae bacterium]